jgi:uncharacterized protein (DUF58 family)
VKQSIVVLLLVVVALVEGLATGNAVFYRLAYSLLGVTLLAYLWAWYNVSWVQLERQTPSAHGQVGKPSEERFLIQNRGLLPKLWLEVRDNSDLPEHHASMVINSLSARRKRGWTVRTVCRRRGRFRLGPLTLSSGDPFGLFVCRRKLEATASMVVYPLAVDLPTFGPLLGDLSGGGSLRRRTHYVTTNVAGVRDYYPGDTFNRIHWPSTARTGRLIVKEFELDPTADVWLFVDMQSGVQSARMPAERDVAAPDLPLLPPKALSDLEPSTEEYIVAVAASLARYFLAHNRAVGLVAHSQHREMVQPDRGDRHLTRLYEILAVIRARGQVTMGQLLAAEGVAFGRNTMAVVVTPSADASWVRVLQDLGRRGVRGTGIVVDGQSFGGPSVMGALQACMDAGIPAYRVREGDALAGALATPTSTFELRRG